MQPTLFVNSTRTNTDVAMEILLNIGSIQVCDCGDEDKEENTKILVSSPDARGI
jgi:hypothetical protein